MYASLEYKKYIIKQQTEFSKIKVIFKETKNLYNLDDIKEDFDENKYFAIKSLFNKNIAQNLFRYEHNLLNVFLPDKIISIGNYAFDACDNLVSINLPNSLTRIGNNAFFRCTKLKNIDMPNFLDIINEETFGECANLETIKLPDELIIIGPLAFRGCKKLKEINIPNNVLEIKTSCFMGCKNLETVKLSNNIKKINSWAFYHCGIKSIIYKEKHYTDISELINILLKNDVEIDNTAFIDCQ